VTKKARKARPREELAVSEDAEIIVTMRVADCKLPVPGSVTRTCALCDAAVFVSPSTFAIFVGRVLPPIWCGSCALAFARRGGTA